MVTQRYECILHCTLKNGCQAAGWCIYRRVEAKRTEGVLPGEDADVHGDGSCTCDKGRSEKGQDSGHILEVVLSGLQAELKEREKSELSAGYLT